MNEEKEMKICFDCLFASHVWVHTLTCCGQDNEE